MENGQSTKPTLHEGFSVRKKKKETTTQTPQPIRVKRKKPPPEHVREEQTPCPNSREKPSLQWN
jgi:hypothetical protein